MKKLFLALSIFAYAGSITAAPISSLISENIVIVDCNKDDDKDKKCKKAKACCKKDESKAKACCKKEESKAKTCCKKDGEVKSCSKKVEEKKVEEQK